MKVKRTSDLRGVTLRPPTRTAEQNQALVLEALRSIGEGTAENVRVAIGWGGPSAVTVRKTLAALETLGAVARHIVPIAHGLGPKHLWRVKP